MFRWLAHVPAPEKRIALLSLTVGMLLLIVKFVAYSLTGSTAIFSDALESIVNVLASMMALYALAYAHRPPDATHPYGHGKAEFVSAGLEGAMILIAAAAIAFTAVRTLLIGAAVHRIDAGLMLVAFAMLANGAVGFALVKVGRARSSITLEADGKHLLTDAVTSAAAIVALLLVRLTDRAWIDPIAALVIGSLIAWQGVGLIRRSLHGLMDRQDDADNTAITALLDAHIDPAGERPQIAGYHKLRHRHSGRYHWVDFHIQLPGTMDLHTAHEIASELEGKIERLVGEGNATAHIEPASPEHHGQQGRSRKQ
jgi:cation diffusion facilitator family transporter